MRILPFVGLLLLAACTPSTTSPSVIRPLAVPPITVGSAATSAPRTDASKLARSSNALGFDLFGKLDTPGDAAISPPSVSIALAMAVGIARGLTATQLTSVMHLDGVDPKAWRAVAAALESRGAELRFVNSFFADMRSTSELSGIVSFRVPLDAVDFEPDGGVATTETRLTFINKTYLLADWEVAFTKEDTCDQEFVLEPGKTKETPTMHRTAALRSGAVDGAHIVELPYKGGSLSMTLIVPDAIDGLRALERSLSNDTLDRIDGALMTQRTTVSLPKFTIDSPPSHSLAEALSALGAPSAFDRDLADFSGMARPAVTGERVKLSDVIHKAIVKVDEKGIEAADPSVTASTGTPTKVGKPPFEVTADRPFLFLVRDVSTGLVVFLGRVSDPRF